MRGRPTPPPPVTTDWPTEGGEGSFSALTIPEAQPEDIGPLCFPVLPSHCTRVCPAPHLSIQQVLKHPLCAGPSAGEAVKSHSGTGDRAHTERQDSATSGSEAGPGRVTGCGVMRAGGAVPQCSERAVEQRAGGGGVGGSQRGSHEHLGEGRSRQKEEEATDPARGTRAACCRSMSRLE